MHPYQIGWLVGFSGAALVYTGLSILIPARETFIDKAVLPDEIYAQQVGYIDPRDSHGSSVGIEDGLTEKTNFRSRLERLL